MMCDASRCSNTLGRCADCPRLSPYDVTELPANKPGPTFMQVHDAVKSPLEEIAVVVSEIHQRLAAIEKRLNTLEQRH